MIQELVASNSTLRARILEEAPSPCIVPWTRLEESPPSVLRPCCWSGIAYAFGIDSASAFISAWRGGGPKRLRQEMSPKLTTAVCRRARCPVLLQRRDWFEKFQLFEYSDSELNSFSLPFLRNRASIMAAFLQGEAGPDTWPLRVKLSPSTRCNLDCIMCYLDHSRPISRDWYAGDVWEELLEYLEELTAFEGEPLLDPVSRRILLDESLPPQTHVSFVTNGTLLAGDVLAKLATRRVGYVDVSLDASTRGTYERIRRGARFDKTIGNVRELVALRNEHSIRRFDIYGNFLVQEANSQEAAAFVDLCDELGILPNFTLLFSVPSANVFRAIAAGGEVGMPPWRDLEGLRRSLQGAEEKARSAKDARVLRHVRSARAWLGDGGE